MYKTRRGSKTAMSSAVPGTSEHQTGLAMDITSQSAKFQLETVLGKRKKVSGFLKMPINLVLWFDTQKRKKRLRAIGMNHGTYVGNPQATYLYDNQLTLEEVTE